LHDAVNDVVRRADQGSRALVVAITVVNGVAEEVFFRGAFYRLLNPRTAAFWTTVCYVVVTAAAGNLMLVLAAALMGTVWALERRATGGIAASALTHVTWSVLVIFLLPR
jgi:membrane protease YdiL (CAAX protease family)